MTGFRHTAVLWAVSIAALAPVCALSQKPGAAPATADASDALPPDFRGTIAYSGTHQGELDTGRTRRRYSGAYNIELTFAGTSVRGRYSGTGGISSGTVSGTRSGTHCRLADDRHDTAAEAICTRQRISMNVIARQGRNVSTIRIEAAARQGAAGSGARAPAATAPRRRYTYSWQQTAEPNDVTDRWVGQSPLVEMSGGNFFWALDTNLSLLGSQDSLAPGQPDTRPIKWGNVIRSTQRDPTSTRRPVRPVYIIPLCRGDECADANRGATRLLAFYENSGYLDRYQYYGVYMVAHRGGMSVCNFEANGGDEIPGADCYFVNRRPVSITPANAAREYARLRSEFAQADADYRRLHPLPPVDPRCFPYVRYPPGSITGVLEFPCSF